MNNLDPLLWEPFSRPVPLIDSKLANFRNFSTRDIFQAYLDGLFQQLQDSLLIAVFGELGNNAFDHNLGKWRDLSGLYFYASDQVYCFGDRGQGIYSSLLRVLPTLDSDLAAVKAAFTQKISGRSPENRGNGLKFVSAAVQSNPWRLYFQSGFGVCTIDKGVVKFDRATDNILGSVAMVKVN